MKPALFSLGIIAFSPMLFGTERFGITPAKALEQWPVLLGKSGAPPIDGIQVYGQQHAVGTWMMNIIFLDGFAEAFSYTKKGDSGAVIPQEPEEIARILTLFSMHYESETLPQFRNCIDCREWQSPKGDVAQYNKDFELIISSFTGLMKLDQGRQKRAASSTNGL